MDQNPWVESRHLERLPNHGTEGKSVTEKYEGKLDYFLGTILDIQVSGFDLLKHWKPIHLLDTCPAILISDADLLKHWGATHQLDASLAILISG